MPPAGIRILTGGLSVAAADGRYVRRFVSIAGVPTLAGNTRTGLDSGGGAEAILENPNGPVHGNLPANISSSLLEAGDGGRFGARVKVIRENVNGNARVGRINGTYAAPTALLSGQEGGRFEVGGYNGAIFTGGAHVAGIADENWSAAGKGMRLRMVAIEPGTLSARFDDLVAPGPGMIEHRTNVATIRYIPSTLGELRNPANTLTRVAWDATGLGFFGVAPIAQPTIVGARGGNAALASLLTQGALLGLWIDGTTP